jgi:hypothetical protein
MTGYYTEEEFVRVLHTRFKFFTIGICLLAALPFILCAILLLPSSALLITLRLIIPEKDLLVWNWAPFLYGYGKRPKCNTSILYKLYFNITYESIAVILDDFMCLRMVLILKACQSFWVVVSNLPQRFILFVCSCFPILTNIYKVEQFWIKWIIVHQQEGNMKLVLWCAE